jgi:hypothetical protein
MTGPFALGDFVTGSLQKEEELSYEIGLPHHVAQARDLDGDD